MDIKYVHKITIYTCKESPLIYYSNKGHKIGWSYPPTKFSFVHDYLYNKLTHFTEHLNQHNIHNTPYSTNGSNMKLLQIQPVYSQQIYLKCLTAG